MAPATPPTENATETFGVTERPNASMNSSLKMVLLPSPPKIAAACVEDRTPPSQKSFVEPATPKILTGMLTAVALAVAPAVIRPKLSIVSSPSPPRMPKDSASAVDVLVDVATPKMPTGTLTDGATATDRASRMP